MKTVLLSAILFATISSNAQFFAKAGIGANLTNSLGVAQLDLGYETRGGFLQAGMMPHLSNEVKGGTILSAKAGHSFSLGESFAIVPAVGYGFAYRSSDKTQLNSQGIIGSMAIEKTTRFDPLKLYAEGTYFDKSFIFSVGIKVSVLNPRDCPSNY